jgi:hypothetical protein
MESTGVQHKYQTKEVIVSEKNCGKLSSLIRLDSIIANFV